MKVDLKRMANAIKSKSGNGPGPKNTYIKKYADKLVKESAEAESMGKRIMGPKVSGAVVEKATATNESYLMPKFIDEMRSDMKGPTKKAPESMRKKMIDEGLFTEKDGDLIPTEKYQKLKKTGGLSKYGIK
jgi:hypothetical protein